MVELADRKCVPCSEGTPPLTEKDVMEYKKELSAEWIVIDNHHLKRDFSFKNFVEALDFTNRIGNLAENEGHHPDIFLSWGKVSLSLFTHKIDGLSEADFVFAAKVDNMLEKSH